MTESERIILPPVVASALSSLRVSGFSAYAVGGCVRDSLLGREPNDWDVTTSALPSETESVFASHRIIETGIRHGTVTVLFDGVPLEITTFRGDGVYLDNRHPSSVSFFQAPEEDLKRRDFTINAMAYSPEEGLLDLFGGREDLAARIIRAVGDPETRFREDGLRILRALRFASVLDFSIEDRTRDAIFLCAPLLSGIASERIREEFCKLICGAGAVRILREYASVIGIFLPELLPSVGFDQNCKYHCFDVWEHTLHALSASDRSDLVLTLALFFHDLGKPASALVDGSVTHFPRHARESEALARAAMERLRFDRSTTEEVSELVLLHDMPLLADRKWLRRKLCSIPERQLLRLVELHRCDRLAHAPAFSVPDPALSAIPSLLSDIAREGDCISLKSLAVNGSDLLSLGIPSGKEIGRILSSLLSEVIDDRLPNDRDSLLRRALEMRRK